MDRRGEQRKYCPGDLSGDGKVPEDREEELRKYGPGKLKVPRKSLKYNL
jgi:hypothetical protein